MNKNCNNISSQRNKYSIRKLTVGTASLLIGATLVFGLGNEAYADELASQEKNNTVANSNENSEPHEQQESTTVDKSQEQSVQQSTQEQTAHETKHIDEAQQSTNETTSKPNAIQHEHIDKDVTNEHASNEEQQNKEESIETQAEPINNKEESVLTEHKPEETKQQITEAEASTEERETSSLEAPENSNVNNSINKPQIIRPEEQKNENTKESRKVNGQAQPDKQSQNKKLRNVVATHEASTRTLKRTKRQTTANRDKTEDASFEALKYSDNYTFQTLIFDPEKLLKDDILKGKNIPFRIHSYMIGANSGERYKINLQLDEVIANHVTKISAIPANQTTPVEFNRVITPEGKRTNIWQVNYIRANNGLFGGAEILSQYTAEGGMIELDDTVGNILNAETDLDGDKLNYLIYVKDSLENTKIRTSESSGYFITKADKSFTNLKLSTSTAANSAFKASSGSVQFDPTIGKYGAFVGDQQILKNGILNYGGPLLDLGLNKQWVYFYKIDPKLIPFADSIELHKYDFKGLAGFDKTYYEETLVAKLPLSQNGEGSITAYDLNTLIEFNNSLPETVGIRIVVKFNQSPNNILIRDGKFDENGNIIPGTSKVREEFTFYGYFTDREGGLIENTFGTSTYYIQDKDRDGLTDSFEIHSSHTDPENADTDNDGDTDGNEYMNLRTSPLISKPKVENVTTDMNSIYGRVDIIDDDTDLEVSIVDFNNKVIGKGKVDIYGQFDIKVSHLTPGKYTANVMSKKYTNPESTTFDVIDITKALKPTIEPVTDIDPNIGILGLSGSTITVKDDKGKFIGRVDIAKDQTGNFIILKKPLKAGTVLIATAKRGKYTSIPSDSVIVKDTSVIDAPTVNPVINRDTSITGKSEPEAVIKVLLPDGNELLTLGDLSGKFEVKLPTDYRLKVGDVIQVSAIDRDSRLSPTATVVVQAYAGFPMVQPVTSESTQINGLATPSSLIKVKLPNGTFLNGQADELGDFTVSIPNNVKFNGGERLELSAISQPGNFALSTPIQVEDATAPVAPTVNEYTDTSTQLSGTTEAGATVKVELPDGTELSSVADNQGNYSVNMPTYKRFNGGEQIKVTSTDAAGNKSEATVIAVKDTTPPVAPTVGEVTSESTQLTGTGEPGSTVKVELPDGTELSGISDNQGNYVIDIPSNKKFIGGERIKVTSTDASGNKSNETVIDVKDTTPPVVPTVSEVTSESTQVTGTGEAGSTVKVELPDGTVLNGVVDDQGNFEIDLPTNNKFNGGERIKVTSTDASGNKSEETVIDVKDTTPPVAPTVSEVTSESTQVTGTGEAGSTVKVELPDGTVLNGVADAQGNYTIDLPANMKFNGGESIKVTSTDVSGNKSNETVIDVKDTTPPVAPTVNEVTSESTQVTGTGEPGSTVMIELSDATDLFGRVDNQGHFTIDIPLNKRFIGGERIKVASIDTSGNKSKEIVIDVKDTTPPVAPTVSEITSESTQVTGTGEPGSTVKVELPDGTELTGVADNQGNYTIDLPSNKKFNGGESIKITSTDALGNKSEETVIDVKDTTPPVTPTVSEVTSESMQVTGTGEPGSTVTVELPDGTELTGVADGQGNYTIDLPSNKKFNGGESIKVTSTDASGNKSNETVIDVKDTTPPVTPTVSEVTSESTQVTGTGEPGSTVKVELPDGTELTAIADDQGNYTIDLPTNKKFQGGESIKVTSTDASGNKSDEKVIDVKDTTPPVAPTVSEVTSESTQVTGTGEPGSTVKVELPDGTELTAIADDQGNYTIDLPSNKKFNGGESIKVTSTDASGNKSDEKVIDVKDTTPPVAPTVSEVTSESTQVTGTGEPGSTVKVELPDGTVLDGVADDQGNYTIDLPSNKKFNGGESIKVTSTDASGNKSDEKVIDVKDTTPPVAPTVSEVTSESTQVTGTGEPGSTVKIELPDGTELSAVADDQGNYVIDIPANKKFNGGETIKITSTDASGNKSDEKVIDVKDTTPPVAPTVSEVTSESTQVTGTGEPGSTVKVELPDGTELIGVADDQGNYTIDLPANKKFNGGESIKVTSTDASGNKSDEKVIDVKDITPPVVPTVSEVTSESTQVTGTGEPGSTVKVELPDGTVLDGIADDQGNYVIDLPNNKKFQGGESIKVTSTDASGNKSDEKVIDVKDTTPPVAPTVSEVTSESTQVTGTGEPGSTVKVELPDGTELLAVADDQGNYVIDIPSNKKFQGGESIKVTSTDASGNKSNETVIDVKDTTPPVAPTVSEVTSESTQVTGTGEPGSTVKVELPDGTELTGVADDQGNYTIDLPTNKKFQGGESIKVTSTDASGNKSDEKVIDVKDTTPPVAPTVSEVTSESTQVTGTGEPGSTVKVELPNGTELTGVADDQGNYTIDLPSNKKFNGGESIKVTSTDASGNKSNETVIDVKDTTPPVAPTVSEVTSESTQVTGTGEPGSTVKVELPDGTELTGVADDQGNYTIDLPTNKKFQGGESIKVTSTDASGNKSGETVIDVKDTTPPVTPTVSEVTSESTQVTGTGEPGSTVKVELPDGTVLDGVADDQGNYTIDLPTNKKFQGGESIKVTSTDASGNKSDEKVIDVKDTTPPVAPTVSEVTSESTQVTGTGEPGSTVKVELPNGTELTGVADDQGNYTIDLPSNKKFNGGESIKVTSTDASGNKSNETVIDLKDTTPPVAPTVSEVTSESTQVTGTGEPGSTVKVELPDGTELTGVADDQGNYTIDLPTNKKFQGGESIKVTSTDASGNKSGETVIDVKDTTPPVTPTVSEVTSESTQVTGTGEPGSTVKVELPDGTVLDGVADDQGNYTIDLPSNKKFQGGESIKVTSTDASGNKSDEKVIDVKDTTPPVAPTVSEVTSESTQVTGTGEPGSTVKVELPDGTELSAVADDQGNYVIDIPANKKFQGGESIKVTSTDASGNKSDEKVIDVKDTTPPVTPTVSEVTSESTQVTGTGEPGSTVKVELPDGTVLDGVADDQGNYVIDLPANKKFNGGESIKVTSTDASGNKSDEKVIDVKDTTPPVAPTVSEVTSESTQVTGTGEPGSTVKVELPDGTELTGVADDQGNYTIDLPTNKKFQGGESIKVTSTDASGNKSDEKVIDVKDTTPPVAPTVSEVTSESTQVTGTGEPGSTVKVEMPDGTVLDGVADDQGNYTIDLPANKKFKGGESIKVTSTDASGNKSDEKVIDVKDTTPPVAPMVSEVTSESTQVTGTGEPGSTVKVELPDGTELSAVTDDQGNYTIDLPTNKKFQGGESIKVTSTDASGNKSDEKVIDVKDTTPPVTPTVSEVTSESTQVTGTGEPGSTVKVELPDGTELTVIADDQGNYTIDLPTNKKFQGGESIKVTSTDASGNKSDEKVIDVKDTTPPVAPTVSEVTSESTQVTGTGEPGSTVKVELPDGTVLDGVADDQGNYTIDLPSNKKFQGGESIKVTSTDASGNKSDEKVIDVKDTTPPVAPTVSEVTSESTQVTGTGEPGSTVKVELPDGTELTGVADDQGNYTIDLPTNKKFNGGESIKVTSTDASGNKSDEKVIDVKDTTPPVAPTVSEVTSESTQVTGTGEPGNTVKVELPDGTELTGVADDQGNYTIDLPSNKKFQGGESIKVTSTDASGNKSDEKVIDVKDTTPPVTPTVSEVTSESTQVTGTGEPGSTVKVELPDGTELTGVADDQGNYTIDLPSNKKFQGGESIKITSTDASGNKSNETVIDVKDTTAPVVPTVSEVTSESTQVTGTGEPGSTVKVELPNGTELTGVADDQGNYVIDLPANKKLNGGESIKVTSTDASGNKSDEKVIDVKDTTPPVAPTVSEVTSESTQVTGTGEPGSTVKVELPDGTELTGVADDQGNYTIDLPSNKKFQGGESIKITSTDASGNKSDEKVIDVKDTTAPVAPTVSEVTSESTQVTGTGEPGSTVKVELPDGTELTGVVDDQGNYTIDLPTNKKFNGGESIKITSTDASGNKSDEKVIDVKDTTPPVAPTVSEVTSESTQVTGTGEPGSTVKVELPDGTELTGVADDQGNYTIDLPSNKKFNGGEFIKVTSTDASGNKSDEKVIDVKDTTPPISPTVDEFTSKSTQVTGTGEPGSTVKVELPNGTELTGVADDQGNYTIDLPANKKFNGGEFIKVTSTDKSNNKSNETIVLVKDTTPPVPPTVDEFTSESTQVTGTGEPGSTIKMELPDGSELLGLADDQGNYIIDLPTNKKFNGGESVKITSIDRSGNKSDEKVIDVKDTTPPVEPTISEVTSESTQITGTSEPGSTVKVELPDGTELTAIADDQGNYTVDLPANNKFQGGESIKVTSTDTSGNKSNVSTVEVRDVTPPNPPKVLPITSESAQISGLAEPNAKIKLTIAGGNELTTVANDQGIYVIALPNGWILDGGEDVNVYAIDASGNVSLPTYIRVLDVTAPEEPIVNPITSESTQITGTTEPGATIKVELPYGTVLTGKADDQGDYTIIVDDANRFRGGEKVKITATDDAGNKSEVIVIDVKDTTPPVVPTVNPFTSQDTLISGTAEPDAIVKVLLPDGTELTATANLQGNYLIDIPNNQKFQGGEKIKLTATDQSGNTSLVEIIDVEDKTPPTPPIIGKLTSESMEISGTSEPGAKIIMVLPDDSELTAVADDQGNYTIDLYDTIFAGNETLRVTATDLAGNKSEATIIQVIDATPPEAPKVNQVTSDDNKVTGTSEENTTVTLTLPDGTELTGQTDDQGNYTIDIPANKQFQGGESIQLTTTDAAGNKSTVTIINVADVTPPVVPSINPITTESTTITGTGEPQAVVRVELPDGTYLVQHVDDQGNYSIDIPSNTKFKGGEQLKVISIDKSFNTSEEKVINVADVTPPKEPVVYPILSFSQGVSGFSEPDALITIKLPSGELLKGKADNNGYYMVPWKDGFELQGGEIIEVFATDAAGNDSTTVRSTVIDRTPPEEPTVNEITSESKVISGNTEPLATIIVEAAYKPTLTVEADQNGNFTLQLPKDYGLQGGEQLKVISMDKEGNQSDVLRVSVTDVTPPKSPLIDEITSESKAITGEAEPLSIIEVNISNGTKIKGKADGFGNFIILLPDNMKLNGGETIEAIATDTSGNASKPTRLTVVDNTPPSIPTVNDLTSEDTMITGTGEVGSTVSVKLPDGTVLKKLVDNKGQYAIELPNKVKFKGGESLQVIAIDKAGNQSAALEIIVEDTTPPVMPKIDSFTTESKQLTGITEPGAVVNVQLPTGEKLSIKADDKGAFAIDLPSGLVFKGGEKLSITATDAQGNETSPIIIIVKDTTIPETPKVNKVTSESTHITGTAEPGALVKVKLPNGKLLTAQVDKQGAFNVELPYKGTFKGGEVLKVSVVDPSSNESLATTIHVEDITAPKSPTVKPITSDNPLVVGTAEVGSTIKVKLPNGKVISTKVDKQGNYKVKIPNNFKLNGGESLIITATDVSGNTSEEITVKVTDNTAPTNPNVNPIDKDSKNISGTAEANATIKIKLPNGKVLVGNADSKGRFDIKVPETVDLSKMKSIKVIAIDANGNASNEVNVDIEQTNHTQDVNQNNGTANDQQSNISHSQALDHVQSDIEQDLSGQHNADKSMNSNRENEPNGSNHEQGELPSTGQNDAVNTTAYGSLMALIGSALLFTRRRKNNDKNKQDN